MDAVVISTDTATGGAKITFTEPEDNSLSIDYYLIEIFEFGSSSTYTESASCDGSDSTTITNMYCIVPMTELTTVFSYTLGQTIIARAKAHNTDGFSNTYSDDNTSGATATTVPAAMSTPQYTALTESSVTITWTALATDSEIGGSGITSYNLYWDNGSGSTTISLLDADQTSTDITGLTAGS